MSKHSWRFGFALAAFAFVMSALHAADVKLEFPLERTNYQTNEQIYFTVVRTSPEALAAGNLVLTLTSLEGSKLSFTFPVSAASVNEKEARSVEHLKVNGWLLRPALYHVEAAVDGVTAEKDIGVYSHIRESSFRLAAWGSSAKDGEVLFLNEGCMGFNTVLSSATPQFTIPAGVDQFRCCVMGGAHQMDNRLECDWSDPYVLRGGAQRVAQQALADRINPNSLGIHFYDEPGLTWNKHPKTGEFTPNNIPTQDRSYRFSGHTPLDYTEVDPKNPSSAQAWYTWGRWKLGLMEAAWKYAQFSVQQVDPALICCNQTVYGWYAFSDGAYFNSARALPVIFGHGGYDDMLSGYLCPSYFLEMGRTRDLSKPLWYTPTWYRGMDSSLFRLEQYLSFMDNVQGIMQPPWQTVQRPSTATMTAGVVESNKLMARLGTIFTTMPVTRPPVAILYSLSQSLYMQANDMKANYNGRHTAALHSLYLASKQCQIPLFPVVEEDLLDGTVAAFHKAIVLTGIDYLEPRVVAALEAYAAAGNAVILSDDCKVEIKGATRLGSAVDRNLEEEIAHAAQERNHALVSRLDVAGNYLKSTASLAAALKKTLTGLGFQPVFGYDSPNIDAARQAEGDVEYLFAANVAYDFDRTDAFETGKGKNQLKPGSATLQVPDDGRPVYDALLGVAATEFQKQDGKLAARFRFGPGEMKAFARTARPIGGVQVGTPVLHRDFTQAANPMTVQLTAAVCDTNNVQLCGAFPLRIQLVDPMGVARYTLFRATDKGQLRLDVPLAVNDPAGKWTVTIGELLSGKQQTASFNFAPPSQCGALAGTVSNAIFFEPDRDTIFRFFRTFREVTVVTGSSPYNAAAAERIAEMLKPWNVNCTIVEAAKVSAVRELTDVEAHTWTGLHRDKKAVAGTNNPPDIVGFALRSPAILLGTPEDNPFIKFAVANKFLPFMPSATFPGPRRGYLAWQLDAVNHGQESITAIAYDEAGMHEAIASLYELAAGIKPLMPYVTPLAHTIIPASKSMTIPEARLAWKAKLADNAVAVKTLADGKLLVLSQAGELSCMSSEGERVWAAELDGGEHWALDANASGTLIVVGASHHVVGLNDQGKTIFDVPLKLNDPKYGEVAPAIRFVSISHDGTKIALGATNGRVMVLDSSGKALWSVGDRTADSYTKFHAEAAEWEAGKAQRAKDQAAFKAANDGYTKALAEWNKSKPKTGEKPVAPVPPAKKSPPQEPKSTPYVAGAFTANNSQLVALSEQALVVFDAADGSILHQENGLKPCALVPSGENFLVTDGNATLSLYSPAEKKIVSKVQLGEYLSDTTGALKLKNPLGIVKVCPSETNLLVAGELLPAVQAVKSLDLKPNERLAWQRLDEHRLVKEIAADGDRVAIAYWGGYTVVLDASTGVLKTAQALPQDVTALTWQKGRLISALADSTVWALDVK